MGVDGEEGVREVAGKIPKMGVRSRMGNSGVYDMRGIAEGEVER